MRRHISYANVMATVLLVLVIGGGTAAAGGFKFRIKPNAVTAAKLKNASVTGDKLKPNSVGTSELQNGAVTNPKLADHSVSVTKLSSVLRSSLTPASKALNFNVTTCSTSLAGCSATVLNRDGLTLTASCSQALNFPFQESLTVQITQAGGLINLERQTGTGVGDASSGTGEVQGERHQGATGPGVLFSLNSLAPDLSTDQGTARSLGTMIYRNSTSGVILDIDFSAFVDSTNGADSCELSGLVNPV